LIVNAEVSQNGFAIIQHVLSPTLCDQLIAAIERANHCDSAGLRQPHRSVPEISQLIQSPTIYSLLPTTAFLVRSILFDKTAGRNWMVPWHQDLAICVQERIETEGFTSWSVKEGIAHAHAPASVLEKMIIVRLHLDPCGAANGPLRVIPGSHRHGRLTDAQIHGWRAQNRGEICVVPRGGALLMRPLLLHASSRATQPGHRRVLHLEFATESLPGGLRWLD
jgi:ectoine hydroxylase-related dioxygenase (phytanoyl-CoA dioxygenase family)